MSDSQPPHPGTPEDAELQQEMMSTIAGGGGKRSQPPGLWVLFITEMWERFSYYGMRAILVLYLVQTTAPEITREIDGVTETIANNNPGFGWANEDAYLLYGTYTFMVYLTSIFGGIAADRLLGTHKSMLLGGWIIALGHIVLALGEFFSIPTGEVVAMNNAPGALLSFMLGLALIIIGTGFFKPCVSVMVGQLYEEHDPRRDSGFTLFYMGINLGAFFSPLVAGTLGEKVGWHWGFGSAAVGMIICLLFYQALRSRYLGSIGLAPRDQENGGGKKWLVPLAVLLLVGTPMLPLVLYATGNLSVLTGPWNAFAGKLGVYGTAGVMTALLLGCMGWFLAMQRPGERAKLAVVFILAFFGNIFFWSAFEQAGSSLTVFADDNTDRTLWGLVKGGFPASWYQSINPLAILIFAPVFSWLWMWLDRKRANPSTPLKFAIGLWLLGLAFLAMVFGAMQARDGLAGPHWLLITYLVITWGELCLSPVGLSMVTKLSPPRLQSLMMGLWFFSLALSNLVAGLVARFSEKFTGPEPEHTFLIDGLPGFFLMLVLFPVGAGLVLAVLTPVLRRMMGNVE